MHIDTTTLTWAFFFIAAVLICFRQTVKAGWLALLPAYILALISGQITMVGIAWLLLTALVLYVAKTYLSGWKQVAAFVAFLACSVLLFMHKLPGFHNLRIFDKVRFSPEAAPFTMYLNLDKPFVGFLLFTFLGKEWHARKPDAKQLLKAITIPVSLIAVICLGVAMALHFIVWSPKFPPGGWIWMLNNLLLVAMCEEALFRGFLQGYVGSRLFKKEKYYVPLFITAFLFGIVHTTGGPPLMLLAFIAGIGYGFAYQRGGIMAAVLAHFVFNLLHFLLFSYPMVDVQH